MEPATASSSWSATASTAGRCRTRSTIPFTDQEAAETLTRAEATLLPEYRGEHVSFGEIVPTGQDASAVDRLVAFLGREPVPSLNG